MKSPYYWPTPLIASLLERALEHTRGEHDQPDLCVPSSQHAQRGASRFAPHDPMRYPPMPQKNQALALVSERIK